jgi:hypothetical protein
MKVTRKIKFQANFNWTPSQLLEMIKEFDKIDNLDPDTRTHHPRDRPLAE